MSTAIARAKKAKATAGQRMKGHAEIVRGCCTAIRPQLDDMADYARHGQIEDLEMELVRVLTSLRAIELETEAMVRAAT